MPLPDLNVALAVIFGAIVLYLVIRILFTPARFLLKLLTHAVIGLVVLLLFNLFAGLFGYGIGVNAVTAIVVGYMGLPGLVMFMVLQRMLS